MVIRRAGAAAAASFVLGPALAVAILSTGGASSAVPDGARWLASRYQIPVDFSGIPASTVRAIACTFSRAAADYPDVAASIRWLGSFPRFVAQYGVGPRERDLVRHEVWAFAPSPAGAARLGADSAIVVSATVAGHEAAFERAAAGSIREGLHAPGFSGIAGAVLHEFGHHVWWTLQRDPEAAAAVRAAASRALGIRVDLDRPIPRATAARIAAALSGYATASWDEVMAEAFVEWYNAPWPRPLATAVGRVVDARLRRAPWADRPGPWPGCAS